MKKQNEKQEQKRNNEQAVEQVVEQTTEQAVERVIVEMHKSKSNKHLLTIYNNAPYVELDGEPYDKVVNFRYAYKDKDTAKQMRKRHFASCQINIDGKTESFGGGLISDEGESILAKHYELTTGETFNGEWEAYESNERASKGEGKKTKRVKAKLFENVDELLTSTDFDLALFTAESHTLRMQAIARAEADEKASSFLASYKADVREKEEALKVAKEKQTKAIALWKDAREMKEDEWKALCESTLEKQNAHTLTLHPELANKEELVAKANEANARADEAVARAEELEKAIANALASGNLEELAELMKAKNKAN